MNNRKKPLRRLKSEIDIHDGLFGIEEPKEEFKEPETWTLDFSGFNISERLTLLKPL